MRRTVASLTSWFCMGVEHGMPNYEVLAKASATIFSYPSVSGLSTDKKVNVVGSLHVAYPFLYPQYYDNEWLQLVTPEHVRCTLEIRDFLTGDPQMECMLNPTTTLVHDTRDLVAFEMELNKNMKGFIEVFNLEDEHEFVQNEDIVCYGHRVEDGASEFEAHKTKLEVKGKTVACLDVKQRKRECPEEMVDNVLMFACTEKPLEMGMCGGPVLTTCTSNSKFVGLVEGIVQTRTQHPLENHVAIIEGRQIKKWLKSNSR